MTRGKFISLEGCEGAGKSTNLKIIEKFLEERGGDILVTREPGGTPLAEDLRSLLLEPRDENVDPLSETLMIFAARAQHVTNIIEPALIKGQWVICDRFTDATRAYQGGGRGVDKNAIELLVELVHPDIEPDLTIFLDLPVDIALQRIQGRALDRFEQEQVAFFERVRLKYLELASDKARIRLIQADQKPDVVAQEVIKELRKFIGGQE